MLDSGPVHVRAAQDCGDGHTNKQNLRPCVFSNPWDSIEWKSQINTCKVCMPCPSARVSSSRAPTFIRAAKSCEITTRNTPLF